MMPASTYLLEIRNLSKHFPGVQALDNAQLFVREGTVHALVGENGAGKSTLMKCLFGEYKRNSGDIIFQGKPVEFLNTKQALDHGISMVHQELNQVPELSVMENVWLGRFLHKGIVVDNRSMIIRTQEIFDSLSIDIDPRQKLGSLSVSQRQLVDIARALSNNARIIVLDEATSSLMDKEIEHLFSIIRKLKERNCSVIYISHKLEEIMAIADEVTIMRDGKWVFTDSTSNLTIDKIMSLMVGRSITNRFPPKDNTPGSKVLLQVRNIRGAYPPAVIDASFDLHEGEILGVAGLMGSRRTEMVETIFGLRTRAKGEIIIENDRKVANENSRQSISNGFGLVTEERRFNGIFGDLDISFNASIASLKKSSSRLGIVNGKQIIKDTRWLIDSLRVKTPSPKTRIRNLSGGNQQKVILGRWLLTNSEILILDEPTRGIDVGAKYEIYQLILNTVKQGKGIIFISSEMPELLGMADRIMVMSDGKMAGIVNARETNQEELMRLAAKYL